MGMVGVGARMMRENPTALMRYIGNFGALSSAVAKAGMDPGGQLVPWGFLPNRFMITNGVTPVARFLTASWKWMTSEDDLEQEMLAGDMVESSLLATGFPWRAAKMAYGVGAFWHSGQAQSNRNFLQQIPIVREVFFGAKNPVFYTEEQEFVNAWTAAHYTLAKVMGFSTMTESLVRRAATRGRELHREMQRDSARLVRSGLEHDDYLDFTEANEQEMLEFTMRYGIKSTDGIKDSIEQSRKAMLTRTMARLPKPVRAEVMHGMGVYSRMPGVTADDMANWVDLDRTSRLSFDEGASE